MLGESKFLVYCGCYYVDYISIVSPLSDIVLSGLFSARKLNVPIFFKLRILVVFCRQNMDCLCLVDDKFMVTLFNFSINEKSVFL
jgi:hypothetical protein